MFEFFGSLFGTSKAGEKIIDGISSAADKLVYTSEEKAEDAATARSEGFAVYTAWLESTSGSRLARRMIALTVVSVWSSEHIGSVILGLISAFAINPSQFEKASQMLATNATENNALVGVVLLFYFGGPAAMEGIKGLVEKWTGKK